VPEAERTIGSEDGRRMDFRAKIGAAKLVVRLRFDSQAKRLAQLITLFQTIRAKLKYLTIKGAFLISVR